MIWGLELFFILPIWERSDNSHCTCRFWAHFRAITFAAPTVVTVWSSVDEFQALAMRLAARVLFPGTGWVAFALLMDLVCVLMNLLGKKFMPRGSLAFFGAICDKTKQNSNHETYFFFQFHQSIRALVWKSTQSLDQQSIYIIPIFWFLHSKTPKYHNKF